MSMSVDVNVYLNSYRTTNFTKDHYSLAPIEASYRVARKAGMTIAKIQIDSLQKKLRESKV